MTHSPAGPISRCLAISVSLAGLVGCGGNVMGDGSSGGNDPGSDPGVGGEAGSSGGIPGSAGEDGTPGVPGLVIPAGCENGPANPRRLRRLTRSQLDHTVADLLHVTVQPSLALPADEKVGGFFSNASVPVDQLVAERYQSMAEDLAVAVDLQGLGICAAADWGSRACAQTFVDEFGLRVYRRPLHKDEHDRYLAFYDAQVAGKGAEGTLRLIARAMLQSPYFLYQGEFGTSDPGAATVRLTGYELASRLSFFLWDSLPDAELFAAARSGAITGDAGLRTQIERMLADPRALRSLVGFHHQWLLLGGLPALIKDPVVFPRFSPAVKNSMQVEIDRFVAAEMLDGDGTFETLLTAPRGYPDVAGVSLYGPIFPAGFKSGDPLPLPQTERAGILTLPGLLAVHAHPGQTSPVHRGLLVRSRFLCQELPDPPANVNNNPPNPSAGATTRQRFAEHSENPTCGGCHRLMDPIGLGFENYDGVGTFRTTENGKPVDASGEISEGGDASGTFDGALALTNKLAASKDVRGCVTQQWFRFALGRLDDPGDTCQIGAITDAFAQGRGDVRALVANIVSSTAFRTIGPVDIGGGP